MVKAKVAIVGVGNCASSLIQGIHYYSNTEDTEGLITPTIGGMTLADIDVVAAFDVDPIKVGKDLSEAIFMGNNNTFKMADVPQLNVVVSAAPKFDGIGNNYSKKISGIKESTIAAVIELIRSSGAEIIVNYLPVGSKEATQQWANIALETRCAFINCIPEFIASNEEYSNKFKEANIPLLGDDIKSQFGATLLHRIMVKHLETRGYKMEKTYQLNFGGNMDFYNMLNSERLTSKKISKQESVRSLQKTPIEQRNVHIGPSDYIEWLEDNKWCYIHIAGKGFGGAPIKIETKLEVCDSPNSAGVIVDLIRIAKLALLNEIGGPIDEVCAFYFKSPSSPMDDDDAFRRNSEWLFSLGGRSL